AGAGRVVTRIVRAGAFLEVWGFPGPPPPQARMAFHSSNHTRQARISEDRVWTGSRFPFRSQLLGTILPLPCRPSRKDTPAKGFRISEWANEEVRVGVIVRCGCGSHASGPRGQGGGAEVLRQRDQDLCLRQASHRHVAMLQCQSKVRLFGRPPQLQALITWLGEADR